MLLTRLAIQAGCSIAEMGQRIPSSEWPYFAAFYEMEPWGYEADNYHASMISSTVANMAGRSLKTPSKITDYITPKPLTEAQQAAYREAKERHGEQ
jgi:hypothetical protein